MPDPNPSINQAPNLPPPSGDPSQAAKYVNQLIGLIESDQVTISHTDLARFDPSSLQDHFLIELKDYHVEISHSKHPNSGKDAYVMLFTNLKKVANGDRQKIILAYMHLDASQFLYFRKSYTQQAERIRRAEEEKRLTAAMEPVDKLLSEMSSNSQPTSSSG